MRHDKPTVVMTGATGFVGTALRRALALDFRLVGLTRSAANIPQTMGEEDGGAATEWRSCDLFSLLELEAGLRDADYAIYLANSRLPSSRLVQGTLADIDLIMADNFARAAQRCGVQQIVYLGGLVPTPPDRPAHLAGRLEVEKTLASGTTKLTTLSAGLIVGPSGSNLRVVTNLVRRLPLMILPGWTLTPTQPIAIEDVVRAVRLCLGASPHYDRQYDIGGPDTMTFREMLERTAAALSRSCVMINIPFRSPAASKLWVTMLGGASPYLVASMVDRLRFPLVARPNPLNAALAQGAKSFEAALRASLDASGRALPNPRDHIRATDDRAIRQARRVRSIQRLPLPTGWTAEQVTLEYYRWLPRAVRPFLRCTIAPKGPVRVYLGFTRWLLIEFTPAPQRSSPDRQLLYITAGALARTKNNPKGRMEFREILDRHCMLVAIHDYIPTLPWIIYRFTQAVVHLWVARRFGRYLDEIQASGRRPEPATSSPPP